MGNLEKDRRNLYSLKWNSNADKIGEVTESYHLTANSGDDEILELVHYGNCV